MGDFMFETSDENELKKKIAKGTVVALFYASWCHDSRAFLPVCDAHAKKAKCEVIKVRIDEEENPIWDDFKIEFVPTVIRFENGKEKKRAAHGNGHYLTADDMVALSR